MSTASSTAPRSRLRRWRVPLIGMVILAVGAVVPLGRWVYQTAQQRAELRAVIADLDTRHPRWRLEQVEAARANIPEAENSAVLIKQARAQIVRPAPGISRDRGMLIEELDRLASPVRMTDEQHRGCVDAFEDSEAAVADVLRIADRPRGRHPLTYAPDAVSTLLRHADDITVINYDVLRFLFHLHVHEGDSETAARDIVVMLNLGRSIGDEPFMISQLIRSARGGRDAVRWTERLLAHAEATDTDLARLQAAFAEEADYDPWPVALRGERAGADQMMIAIQQGILKPSFLQAMASNGAPKANSHWDQFRRWLDDRFPPDVPLAHATLLRLYTRLIDEVAPLPWHERPAATAAILDSATGIPALAQVAIARPKQNLAGLQSGKASFRTIVAALAVERYRLRHGRWPDSLDVLVPDFLPAVPIDPFNGTTLRLKRLADAVVIYSDGPDGIDNGGNVSNVYPQPDGTDVGIRLWDVHHRRRPPNPAEAQP